VLESLLGSGAAQKTVAAVDWRIFKPIYAAKRHRPLLDEIGRDASPLATAPVSYLLQTLDAAPAHERWDLLLRHVRAEAAKTLGFDVSRPIDVHQGFFKLGMNSIMTVQLRSRLEADLKCTLPSTIAFEYPTIHALASYLAHHVLRLDLPGAQGVSGDTASSADHDAVVPAPNVDDLAQADLLSLLDRELAAANALVEGESR
jgi:acyl carrier protein